MILVSVLFYFFASC